MRFELAISFSVQRLYNGRRSVYARVTIGSRNWYLSRWDTARVSHTAGTRYLRRGPVMTWYCGGF